MEHEIQTNTAVEDNSSHPAQPEFNATVIAAAQPVQPLAPKPAPQVRNRPGLRFPNGKLGLLAVVLIGSLLSAAVAGAVFGVHESLREQSVTETPADAPVISKTVDEAPKASVPVRTVPVGTVKVTEAPPRISRRPVIVEAPRPDLAETGDKPVARRIGVIVFARGKQDRPNLREETRPRRYGKKGDDQ